MLALRIGPKKNDVLKMKEAHEISSLSCLNAFAEKNIATTARRHVETANQLLKPIASMYYHSILFISVQSFLFVLPLAKFLRRFMTAAMSQSTEAYAWGMVVLDSVSL